MKRHPTVTLLAALVMMVSVGVQASPASAAPVSFGAKLTRSTQPNNSAQRCDRNAGVPTGSNCTWVATTAFEAGTGVHYKAPKTGTIRRVKLVTCAAGSFRVQVAQKTTPTRFKVVRGGPTIAYKADPFVSDGNPETACGGEEFTYVVQSFAVNFPITKGDYIAVKAKKVGPLHCSGGGASLIAPALSPGQSGKVDTEAGCDLLVSFVYG